MLLQMPKLTFQVSSEHLERAIGQKSQSMLSHDKTQVTHSTGAYTVPTWLVMGVTASCSQFQKIYKCRAVMPARWFGCVIALFGYAKSEPSVAIAALSWSDAQHFQTTGTNFSAVRHAHQQFHTLVVRIGKQSLFPNQPCINFILVELDDKNMPWTCSKLCLKFAFGWSFATAKTPCIMPTNKTMLWLLESACNAYFPTK